MSTNTGAEKKGKLSGKGSNLALQAGILAGAGIVSRIIGLLYRSPLYQILGDEGNGYYGSAYAIYAMVIMIATYSIPTAVSKLVAGKIAMGQYKSARRIYYCTFIYVVIAGAVAAHTLVLSGLSVISQMLCSVLRYLHLPYLYQDS